MGEEEESKVHQLTLSWCGEKHTLLFYRDKKERRKEKQKGQQNGDTSPTHNPMQPGENGIENPDFNKEVCQAKINPDRVRNCAFLVANATKNFALATRISPLVASGLLTTLIFHATIITQTIALIFSQID